MLHVMPNSVSNRWNCSLVYWAVSLKPATAHFLGTARQARLLLSSLS
jgi:hypothetical protein